MASYLHRTATTFYPCCIPALGDSKGAGRVGLAAAKISIIKCFLQEKFQKMCIIFYPPDS